MNRIHLRFLAIALSTFSVLGVCHLTPQAGAQTQAIQAIRISPANSATTSSTVIVSGNADDENKTESTNSVIKKADNKPAEKTEEKKLDPAEQRLEKIKKQTFNRKPATILKTWAESLGVVQASPKSANSDADTSNLSSLPPELKAQAEAALAQSQSSNSGVVVSFGKADEKGENSDSQPSDSPKNTKLESSKPAEDPFDQELKLLSTNVTLGRWDKAAEHLRKLPPNEAVAAWRAIVKSLGTGQVLAKGVIALDKAKDVSTIPADSSSSQTMLMQRSFLINGMNMSVTENSPELMAAMQGRGPDEQNMMSVNDLVALLKAAPQPVEDADREPLARLVVLVEKQTDATEDLVRQLQTLIDPKDPIDQKDQKVLKDPKALISGLDIAVILCAANLAADAGPFLPSSLSPEVKSDPTVLNLMARHSLAKYNRLGTPELVNQAWEVLQAVMALEVKTPEQSQAREEATKQAVAIVPKVDKVLSQRWFNETFKGRPERGVALLTSLGESASGYLQTSIRSSDPRLQNMQQLKTAVDALLAVAPERADEWRESLTTLAAAWLAEARLTKAFDRSTAPQIQRDMYGNVYYSASSDASNMPISNPNMPQALPAREIVKLAPLGGWLERVDRGLHPNIHKALAEIYLKMGGDAEAFPHIEEVARTEPEMARELAQEFLRVWTTNHDMNQARNQRNPYVFVFGFEQKAEGIPLTRSKQERNLQELTGWLARLKKLPIRAVDESLITKAFTTCHSSAEVYRKEAITSVFGPMENLRPETIARLAQQMRLNLAGLWRRPAVQDQAKTKRKEKDIREEVLRGYESALQVVAEARLKYPQEWSLTAAQAALMHDENNFRQEIALSPDFIPTRRKALALFAEAASQYAAVVATLSADRQTNDLFDQWFYAGLGACEPGQITETTVPEQNQPALIREALNNLPGAAAESHINRFANQLFTRMSALAPAVKFRYLKGGFEIAGDASQAYEARKVYDYYKDLNREIQLEVAVDGPTSIDSSQPFGVYVNLRHTREIERESGGFARYLQNQNQGSYFYYNYGRPLENYRDKFQDAATKALQEHFEVLSVTFETEKVTSIPLPETGWRATPYAYLLLKAKSPKVDRIPSLKLDLDFMDTSGYMILPVESAPVAVNCNPDQTSPRPFRDIEITQILDERQSADGKLILEIKTTGHGLTPPVGELLKLNEIPFFKVEKIDDQGLAVSRFDEDSSTAGIVSERTSLVTLQAASGLTSLPSQLQFPQPKTETAKITYQKYVDADLATAEPTTALLARYGTVDRTRQYAIIAASVAAIVFAGIGIPRLLKSVNRKPAMAPSIVPAEPFAVLGLLHGLKNEKSLSQAMKEELSAAIQSVEESFFSSDFNSTKAPPNLDQLVIRWSRFTTSD